MKVELKWFDGARKRPVPATYACNIAYTQELEEMWSCVLKFQHNTRTIADVCLYMLEYTEIPAEFYITEGRNIVAEARMI